MIKPITIEEIHEFNDYLMNYFGEKMKSLISQLENIPEMPNEIVCKYWIRAYTLETEFYNIVKSKLMQKKEKFLLPYIKMSYEGIKNKTFKTIYDQELYRGGVISNNELEKLNTYSNSNQNAINDKNLPKVILYFKPYQSFTKKKSEAFKFMKKATKKDDNTKVLFIINRRENPLKDELFSNAYIKDFSRYPSEDEVLFFPYSCFSVGEIIPVEDHKEIHLEYLGKYRTYIESKKPKELLFDNIPITQFGKDIAEFGLSRYNFKKYWKVVKSIKIEEGNCSSILCLNPQILLLSVKNFLRIYDFKNDKIIQNIKIATNKINNLLRIDENIIITSTEDKTIKIIELTNNYSEFKYIKSFQLHKDSVNQTIKLKGEENTFASCSKDKTIKIFKLEKDNYKIYGNLEGHESEVISIFELPNNIIISASELGFLKFWENKICIKTLGLHEKPLYNNIYLVNKNIISVSTKNSIFFIDFIKKENVKKYSLELSASSVCNFSGNIIFGIKKSYNLCFLREYQILDNNDQNQLEVECVGKGKDKALDISYIQAIDDNFIVTSDNNNFVKIWEKTDKSPENYDFEEKRGNLIMENEKKDEKIELLENEIKKKDIIIDNLNCQLKKLYEKPNNFDDNMNQMNYSQKGKEEIVINFLLMNGIKKAFKCFKNEIFANLAKRVLDSIQELKSSECYFLCNGKKIKEYKSIKENGIEDNDNIMIVEYK